jgi:MoxR-like ATPase
MGDGSSKAGIEEIALWAERTKAAVGKAFFGNAEIVEMMLAALLAKGHVLLEDVPGTGKTILARAISATLSGAFSRIQCTPDLLPADVLGTSIYDQKSGDFTFRPGPILSNVVLVDEINRATPRTQSAFLEAMAEGQLSLEGKALALPDPFFLIATENPVEFEGTFPLPEAQKDRFLMTLTAGYPEAGAEAAILESQRRADNPVVDVGPVAGPADIPRFRALAVGIHVEESVRDYVVALAAATRADERLRLGISPRGSLALYKSAQALAALRGRDYVTPEDVREAVLPVYRTRLILKPETAFRGIKADRIIEDVLDRVAAPEIKRGM